MEQGDPKKAFECFEEAIQQNPNDPDIYYHRGQGEPSASSSIRESSQGLDLYA